jgi:hypothetical protein
LVLVVLAAASGCGEKSIEMTMVEPPSSVAAQYDTSCVKAVQLYLNGTTYPENADDYELDCVDVKTPSATFAGVHKAIAGQFDLNFPASGLSGVEMYAYSGPCDAARPRDFDLVFYGSAAYIGQDPIEVQATPNVSCAQNDVTVRAFDLLKLVATKSCAMSPWRTGKLGLTTLSPLPFTGASYWWGGLSAVNATADTLSVRGPTTVAPKSCLAIGLYTTDWLEVTCTPPADQRVCASGSEIEAPMINLDVGDMSINSSKYTQWGGLVYGVVWGTGPMANATVTIDPDDATKGQVVYYDMPAGAENGMGALTELGGATATNATGLFGVYTESLVHITITANGQTVKRIVGGNEDEIGAMVVKL